MLIVGDKCVFIHIPKTAGSSFTKIVSKYCKTTKETYMGRGGWQGTYHFNNGVDNGQHTSINNLSKSELSMIKNLPVITIVRNPYSLIISFFEDVIEKNNQMITLKEYLKIVKDKKLLDPYKPNGHYNLLQMNYIENIF